MRAACLVLMLVLAGCADDGATSAPSVPVSSAAGALLAAHGHAAAGPTTVQEVAIGDTRDVPWMLYLEASRAIGLDFGGQEGSPAEVHVTPVAGGGGPVNAYVLVREGHPIGGWLDAAAGASGVRSLRDDP